MKGVSFETQLKDFLTGFEKLIILGVGNELISDDGIGPFIISRLKRKTLKMTICY